MTLLMWLLAVLAVVVALLLLHRFTRLEFVAHAKLLLRAWSVWLTGVGTLLGVYLAGAPDAIITTWNMLPPDLKALLPVNIAQYISYFLVALGVLSQFIRQRSLLKEKREMDKQP